MRIVYLTILTAIALLMASCNQEQEYICHCVAMNAVGDTLINYNNTSSGNSKFALKKECDNDREMYENLHPNVVCTFK